MNDKIETIDLVIVVRFLIFKYNQKVEIELNESKVTNYGNTMVSRTYGES